MNPGSSAKASNRLAGISMACSQNVTGGSLGPPVDTVSITLIRVKLQFDRLVESPALSLAACCCGRWTGRIFWND